MCGLWDLNSPTGDYTWALGHDNTKNLNPWTIKEFPLHNFSTCKAKIAGC